MPSDYLDYAENLAFKPKELKAENINQVNVNELIEEIKELSSKNRHLLNLQANQDKEVERLRDEIEELKHFDGKNVCAENEVLRIKVEVAFNALFSAGNYLTCMDDLSELNDGKCNEQMALEIINDALKKIK